MCVSTKSRENQKSCRISFRKQDKVVKYNYNDQALKSQITHDLQLSLYAIPKTSQHYFYTLRHILIYYTRSIATTSSESSRLYRLRRRPASPVEIDAAQREIKRFLRPDKGKCYENSYLREKLRVPELRPGVATHS